LMTPTYPKPNVFEREAPRGGEYYAVDLSDGRQMEVLRKKGDPRVWLGRPDNFGAFSGQRGGIGRVDKLLEEWGARTDVEGEELFSALRALVSHRDAASDSES
jgi:hypothetical protein